MARTITMEHKEKMKVAAAARRAEVKKQLEAALAGKAKEEKDLAELEFKRQQTLKKIDAQINRQKRILRKKHNAELIAIGICVCNMLANAPDQVKEWLIEMAQAQTDERIKNRCLAAFERFKGNEVEPAMKSSEIKTKTPKTEAPGKAKPESQCLTNHGLSDTPESVAKPARKGPKSVQKTVRKRHFEKCSENPPQKS